jgi:hypothetical protein
MAFLQTKHKFLALKVAKSLSNFAQIVEFGHTIKEARLRIIQLSCCQTGILMCVFITDHGYCRYGNSLSQKSDFHGNSKVFLY